MVWLLSRGAFACACACDAGIERAGAGAELSLEEHHHRRVDRRRAPAWTCWCGSMPKSCRRCLGKPVVVENKPGAATMLAAAQVATSPPDGHTLVVLTSAALAINQTLYKQINYSPENDFVPISLYVKSPFILVVNPNLPVKTVPEFIKHAKEAKPPLNYATVGAGALQHLSMEFAKQRFGFDATHVPYRQTGQSVTDLAAGHVDVGFVEAGASIPLIKEGQAARARGVVARSGCRFCPTCRRSRKPPARRISRRCPGTSCWRRRRRRRTSSIACTPR